MSFLSPRPHGETLVQRINCGLLSPTLNFVHSPVPTFHLQPWCSCALSRFQLHWVHSGPFSGPAHGFSTSVIFTHHTLPSKKTTSSGQLPMTPTGCGSLLLSNPPAHTERVTHVILNIHCHVSILTLKTVCFYLKIYFLKGKDYLLGFFVSPRIPYLIACVLLLFLIF